jgi:hypothetical protein
VAEGFGFVFLEPSLDGCAVIGRDLPEITCDFVAEGMAFSGLQRRLEIPFDWINRGQLIHGYEQSFHSTLQAFGRPPPSRVELTSGIDRRVRDGCLDFGALTVGLQESVLQRVGHGQPEMGVLQSANPWLCDSIRARDDALRAEAEKNAGIVKERYSLSVSGDRLAITYRHILDSPREPAIGHLENGDRILDTFLSNIEAILLDVYGTLLVSSSGEIGSADDLLHAGAFH